MQSYARLVVVTGLLHLDLLKYIDITQRFVEYGSMPGVPVDGGVYGEPWQGAGILDEVAPKLDVLVIAARVSKT